MITRNKAENAITCDCDALNIERKEWTHWPNAQSLDTSWEHDNIYNIYTTDKIETELSKGDDDKWIHLLVWTAN